ncbi:MAG: SMI1/KNR4 family protein [Deltaproteobacteria bacterium]|nr:SMI1/KNR4 family protein [Deltaproteobacteria bacterium]
MTSWPTMLRRGPEVTLDDVRAFEAAFGHTLPDDYAQFLLDVNGGRTPQTHRRFERGILNHLLSLNDLEDEASDLLTRAARARQDLPAPHLLVVGYDDGGMRIIIPLEGEMRGQVWGQLTTDARPADANPRVAWHDRRDFHKIADNFRSFISNLRPLR